MCKQCNKAHAADQSCAIAGTRTAADILAGLERGIAGMNDTIAKQAEQIAEMQKAQKARSAGATLPGVEDEKRKFSFHRLVVALKTRNHKLAEYELDVCQETNKRSGRHMENGALADGERDLSADLDTAGGYLVPNQVSSELIPLFRANLVTGQLGVTRMDGLTGGAFMIPKQTGTSTAYDVAEAAAITKSQQAIGQVEMRPRELAALTVLSNRLLRLSNPAAEGMIREDLVKVIDLAQDLRILRGQGNFQPVGITYTPGITTRSVAAALSVDNLYNMIYDVEKNNAMGGRMGWAMHPRTWNGLRQLKDAEGRYILTTNGTSSGPDQNSGAKGGMLLGYPFVTTTQVPITLGAGAASQIYFGNWADVVLANWFNLEISASNETSDAFQKNQTWIRIITEYDIVVKHGASFCLDSTIL